MKKAEIIVLAGQSNAVGVGHARFLPEHFSAEEIRRFEQDFANIKINYHSHNIKSGGFVGTGGLRSQKNGLTVGPELGIADYINEYYPEREIFIVKCAFGGTSVSFDWLVPSQRKGEVQEGVFCGEKVAAGWCYDNLVNILKESIAQLKEQGYAPAISAFCWMQGESDAERRDFAEVYADLYKALIADFNYQFGEYLQEWRHIDAAISEIWEYRDLVNGFKAQYAKEDETRVFIDTVAHGLTTKNEPTENPDIYHYDSDSVIKLGRLFAAAAID